MQNDFKVLEIWYDDDQLKIIDKVNRMLKEHNLQFIDDNKEHDGFYLFELKEIR